MSIKQALELCLAEGRRRESAQTSWIHGEDREVVPLFDNACFILGLFRSRSVDHFQEGIKRLERLLAFQAPNGGFSSYLHEYGSTQERAVNVRLLVVFFWMQSLFASLMSQSLRQQLKAAVTALWRYCEQAHRCRAFAPGLNATFAALMSTFDPNGHWVPNWNEELRSSSEWGDWLFGVQVASEEKNLLPKACSVWQRLLGIYAGSPTTEFRENGRPQLNFFHLFMADKCKYYPAHLTDPHRAQITASLIFPCSIEDHLEVGQSNWLTSAIDAFDPKSEPIITSKGFHLIRHCWLDQNVLHSLVCQEKRHCFNRIGDSVFTLTYPEELPLDKASIELSLFVDYHPDVTIWVNKTRATLFRLSDSVHVKTPTQTVTLSFSLLEGEATLCGHISRGNRPAETAYRLDVAHDWRIDLRTIRRTERLTLKCVLEPVPCSLTLGCQQQVP
ncbi:MAG: hypothetical protein AAF443_08030 [Chlamydiota bacterium]